MTGERSTDFKLVNIYEVIGGRIRAYRKKMKYSQEVFGSISGVNNTYIGKIERGEQNVTINTLYKIAIAMDIPLKELFDFEIELNPKEKNPLIHKIALQLEQFDEPELEYFSRIVTYMHELKKSVVTAPDISEESEQVEEPSAGRENLQEAFQSRLHKEVASDPKEPEIETASISIEGNPESNEQNE